MVVHPCETPYFPHGARPMCVARYEMNAMRRNPGKPDGHQMRGVDRSLVSKGGSSRLASAGPWAWVWVLR